jgi:DNA-binding IclR family transcriptional regulator
MNDSIVKSVGRVFEVLELFDAERAALTATAIARTLKYPASSTVALLKSMVRLGYLTYDYSERTYLPTIRLALIGTWLEHSFYVDGHLFELMDDVSKNTEESTFLSWQSDLDVQSVRFRLADNGLAPLTGSRAPLFSAVTGLTALTIKRDVDVIKLAERVNQLRRKQDPQVDVPAIMEQIRRFRALGYGVEYDDTGTGTMAWVLRQKGTSRALVLSILGPADRIKANEKSIVTTVKAALKRYGA